MIKFSHKLVYLFVALLVSTSCSKSDDSEDGAPIVEGRILINYDNNQKVYETIIGGTHQEECNETGNNVFTLLINDAIANIEIELVLVDYNTEIDAFALNTIFPILGFLRGGNGIYGTFQFTENNNYHNLSNGQLTLTSISAVNSDEVAYENAYYLSAIFTIQDPNGYEISGELRNVIFRSFGCN